MRRDIGDILANSAMAPSKRGEARSLLEWLSASVEGAKADWDEEAGEDWARVLVGTQVVAFVWMRAPLAIVSSVPESVLSGLAERQVAVAQVPDMGSACLCVERRSCVTQFAGRPISDVFNHECFSAEDLVWAT